MSGADWAGALAAERHLKKSGYTSDAPGHRVDSHEIGFQPFFHGGKPELLLHVGEQRFLLSAPAVKAIVEHIARLYPRTNAFHEVVRQLNSAKRKKTFVYSPMDRIPREKQLLLPFPKMPKEKSMIVIVKNKYWGF
jgi:hypothetical protein